MALLPLKCRRYLNERGLAHEEVEVDGQKAVIFRGFPLPLGRFNETQADILILLPASYPDAAPDMFYALPWLRLVPTQQFPRAADQPVNFQGAAWQRWSRHNETWRPGSDGIWTMLKRVEVALEIAA